MGTNYYARVIPTKKRKQELCDLINKSSDFEDIINEINKTYGNFEYYVKPSGGVIHLGKRSAGWKFLWNPNIWIEHTGHMEGGKYIPDPPITYEIYPLTKEGIKNFIDREDIEIYDEYGEFQDKEEFFDMAINWTTWREREAWDSKSYEEYELLQNSNYRPYICSGEYIDILKSKGYKMISDTNSDFYSDGLRFSTNNQFS